MHFLAKTQCVCYFSGFVCIFHAKMCFSIFLVLYRFSCRKSVLVIFVLPFACIFLRKQNVLAIFRAFHWFWCKNTVLVLLLSPFCMHFLAKIYCLCYFSDFVCIFHAKIDSLCYFSFLGHAPWHHHAVCLPLLLPFACISPQKPEFLAGLFSLRRVGKHCVCAGFGSPHMTMLHFRPVDPCDLRCTCA